MTADGRWRRDPPARSPGVLRQKRLVGLVGALALGGCFEDPVAFGVSGGGGSGSGDTMSSGGMGSATGPGSDGDAGGSSGGSPTGGGETGGSTEGAGTAGLPCAEWSRQVGTPVLDRAAAVAVGPAGNVILAGRSRGAYGGQPWAGSDDALVVKFDPEGGELWARELGSGSYDAARGVAVDGAGNVLVAGQADDGMEGAAGLGGGDGVLIQLAPDGNTLWVRILGSPGPDTLEHVVVDGEDNVYVVGTAGGSMDGQPFLGGGGDGLVARFSPTGDRKWTRLLGTAGADEGLGVAALPGGGVVVAGAAGGPMAGLSFAGGSSDGFVLEVDAGGKEQWVALVGTPGADRVEAVAADGEGGVYVTGAVEGALAQQTSVGGTDLFAGRLGPDGGVVWLDQLGSPGDDAGAAVLADGAGRLWITGVARGPFAGGVAVGDEDLVVLSYDLFGAPLGVDQLGTPAPDLGTGLARGPGGGVFVSGSSGAAFLGGAPVGNYDMVLFGFCP